MFYFSHLLDQGLGGIDATAIVPAVTGIGYAILLASFLVAIYQAAMRGGDLAALAAAAIRYLVVAIILANWSALFRELNAGFAQVSGFISSSSGAGDMFLAWMDQLSTQFTGNGFSVLIPAVSGSMAAIVTALMCLAAYLIYAVMVAVFAFFYVLYGCLLYVLGPLILASLPALGMNKLAKSYAASLVAWNSWAILYGTFAALITAIHFDRVDQVMNQGFLAGFFAGTADSTILGLVSVFYALALGLIPLIARQLIAGDAGSTAYALVRAASAAAADLRSAAVGFELGGRTSSALGESGMAGSTLSSGSGFAAAAGFSSSTPPPQPTLADTIRNGIRSAVDSSFPPAPPEAMGQESEPAASSAVLAAAPVAQSRRAPRPPHPGSLAQLVAFHAGRIAADAMKGGG